MAKKPQNNTGADIGEQQKLQELSARYSKEQLDSALELYDTLRKMRKEYGGLLKDQEEQLNALQDYLDGYEEYDNLLSEIEKKQKKVAADQEKAAEKQKASLKKVEELYESIAEKMGTQTKGGQTVLAYIEKQKSELQNIVSLGQKVAAGDAKKQEAIDNAIKAYAKFETSVANTVDRVSDGSISQEKANKEIAKARSLYNDSLQSITNMGEEGKDLLELLTQIAQNAQVMGSAASKTVAQFNILDDTLKRLGSHIPLMGELTEAIEKAKTGGVAFTAAMAALGAAIGAMAGKYFLAGPQAEIETYNQIRQLRIDTEKDVAKLANDKLFVEEQIGLESNKSAIEAGNQINKLYNDAAFITEKVDNQFAASLRQNAAQFESASKTALFGKGIGSVSYAAGKLQMAGIDAKTIANQMKAVSTTMGKMPSSELASDMAVFAAQGEISGETVADINRIFQGTTNLSAKAALNLQAGVKAMADKTGVNFSKVMEDIAASAKSVLGFNTKNSAQLQRQAFYANSIGVSTQKLNQLGENMVLNYKDSIKAEMQLSSLLGEQVDLSEVRARFAENDTIGALEALKAQGLDINEMNAFQRQALQQALPGLDLLDIENIMTKQGVDIGAGGAPAVDTKKMNEDFLTRTTDALKSLEIKQAQISSDAAIIDAKLAEKINQAFLQSDEYTAYQLALKNAAIEETRFAAKVQEAFMKTDDYIKAIVATKQLDIEKGFTENLIPALSSAVGAAIFAAMAGGGLGKMFGGLGNLFKGGGTVTSMAGGGGLTGAGGGMMGPAGGGAPAGTTGVGGFLSNLGAGIGNLLKSIGTGAGQAIGGFFQGMTSGLLTFANAMAAPTPLFGLPAGLIIVGMAMGIAKALDIAAPGIQALTPLLLGLASIIGDTFVKAMNAAGPVITAIFEGMGNVITSIGASISQVIITVTDSITRLASLPTANLFLLGTALTAVASGLAAFTVGSAVGGVVSSIGGAISSGINFLSGNGSGDIFTKLTEFSSKANQLNMVASSVRNLSSALSEMASITFNNVTALNDLPWVRMTAFAAAGGTYPVAVESNQKNVAASSKVMTSDAALFELKAINTNTKALVDLTRAMETIAEETFEKTFKQPIELKVDGKTIASANLKYLDSTKGQKTLRK